MKLQAKLIKKGREVGRVISEDLRGFSHKLEARSWEHCYLKVMYGKGMTNEGKYTKGDYKLALRAFTEK